MTTAVMTGSSTYRSLLDLPDEVLILVIQQCPGATLKNLCRVNQRLAQIVSPVLWAEVVLVPNELSILGMDAALRRPSVAQHVTKLTYDARFEGVVGRMRTCLPEQRDAHGSARREQATLLLDRLSAGCLLPSNNVSVEQAMLARLLRRCPNVRHIWVREYGDNAGLDADRDVPHFYRRMCRTIQVDLAKAYCRHMARVGTQTSRPMVMLSAAYTAGSPLCSFQATGVAAGALFGSSSRKRRAVHQQLRVFRMTLGGLQALDLSFWTGTLNHEYHHIDCLRAVLEAASQLTCLSLRLTDRSGNWQRRYDSEYSSDLAGLLVTATGGWLTRPLLPNLACMNIAACVCLSEELLQFLGIHALTLRRLRLSNVTLMATADRRGCWVSLIKHFKSMLNLTSITFEGWLSNGGRQHWFVAQDKVGPDRLKARVERYVLDRHARDCPLEALAIKPNADDVALPADGTEVEGDLSWTMVYWSDLDNARDLDGWELTPPSFGNTTFKETAAANHCADSGVHHDGGDISVFSASQSTAADADAISYSVEDSSSVGDSDGYDDVDSIPSSSPDEEQLLYLDKSDAPISWSWDPPSLFPS